MNTNLQSYVVKFPIVDVGGGENIEAFWRI